MAKPSLLYFQYSHKSPHNLPINKKTTPINYKKSLELTKNLSAAQLLYKIKMARRSPSQTISDADDSLSYGDTDRTETRIHIITNKQTTI